MAYGAGDWNITCIKDAVDANQVAGTVLAVWSVPFDIMVHGVYVVVQSTVDTDTTDAVLGVNIGAVAHGAITVPDATVQGHLCETVFTAPTATAAYQDAIVESGTIVSVDVNTQPVDPGAEICVLNVYVVWAGQ